MLNIIILLVLCFLGGGWPAVKTALTNLWVGVTAFFPLMWDICKNEILLDPYLITKIIFLLFSAFGLWFGHRGGKIVFQIVSFIVGLISFCSLFV